MKQSSRTSTMILKVLGLLFYAFILAVGAWMLISWIDIIADNCRPNPSHYDWNFFIVMMEWTEPWRH